MLIIQVFISYSHENSDIANRLKYDLERKGIDIWVDHEKLIPATQNWRMAIEQGIKSVDALIYVASPAAKGSDFVVGELIMARNHRPKPKPIIPFWVDGEVESQSIPLEFTQIQLIDARLDWEHALSQLAVTLGKLPIQDPPKRYLPISVNWDALSPIASAGGMSILGGLIGTPFTQGSWWGYYFGAFIGGVIGAGTGIKPKFQGIGGVVGAALTVIGVAIHGSLPDPLTFGLIVAIGSFVGLNIESIIRIATKTSI